MKLEIRDLLKADLMIFNLSANDKKSAIEEIADKFYEKGYVKSREDFKNGLIKREEEGSTALGESVAIPHTKNETVKEPAVLFARKVGGLDYQALDGEPTEIFFAIGAPAGANNLHVETLAELSKMLMKDGFINDLKKCESADDVYGVIEKYSEKKKEVLEEKAPVGNVSEKTVKLLAVTACPNGVYK